MSLRIREDFAAAGGVSMGLRWAGFADEDSMGVEFDESAVATARAMGHRRILADVRAVRDMPWGKLDGYSAGPPCQTFSAAGGGEGRRHLDNLAAAVQSVMLDGTLPEAAIANLSDEALDERSILVLEPALVIARHRPTWIVLEQVPQVLPVWEAYVVALRELGYSADARILRAEQYGVPQTRKRAILIAHAEREVVWPTPTHSAFYPKDRPRLDPGVLPWVSMAQALGWGMTKRPYPTIACARNSGGPDKEKVGGSGARAQIYAERVEGSWVHGPGCDCPDLAWCGINDLVVQTNNFTAVARDADGRRTSRGSVPYERPVTAPAPTLDTRVSGWQVRPASNGPRPASELSGREAGSVYKQPVPAIEGETLDDVGTWPWEGPSPTIVGSYRPDVVAKRGYRKPGDPPRQKTPGSVRITLTEAGVLQSFPPDYAWQGTDTKKFQQVGNAAPPLMMEAVIRALLGLPPRSWR